MGDKSIVFVTNFYDIRRGNWDTRWKRTTDTYMECFRMLARVRVPLIVYIHDMHYECARRICETERVVDDTAVPFPPLTLVPYDEAFLKEHIRSWAYLDTEAAIMQTAQYREWTRARNTCPETRDPQYNCINHAKIDFVCHAIHNGGFVNHVHDSSSSASSSSAPAPYEYYGWVDFGYLKPDESDRTFPPNGAYAPAPTADWLDPHKVTLVANVLPDPAQCTDPVTTLVHAPEWFTGGFWAGGKCALIRYRDQYHSALQAMHAANVADDDQAVMSFLFGLRHPNIQLLKNRLLPSAGWATGFMLTNALTN